MKFTYSVLAKVSQTTFIEKDEKIEFTLSAPYPKPAIDCASIPYTLNNGGSLNVNRFDIFTGRFVHFTASSVMTSENTPWKLIHHNSISVYFLEFTATRMSHITKNSLLESQRTR